MCYTFAVNRPATPKGTLERTQWCRNSSGDTMKQHVSIARALKEKSRIAGRIHTLTDVINHENSLAEGSTRSVGL